MDQDIEIIQSPPTDGEADQKTPVIFIHDISGCTVAYHFLESLDRPVYGISSPQFEKTGKFEGDVYVLAKLYACVIKRCCSLPSFKAPREIDGRPKLLIGGWSLGGLLSLEISRHFTGNKEVSIIGVLLIDAMYPMNSPEKCLRAFYSSSEILGGALPPLDDMLQAIRITEAWKPPRWEGREALLHPHILLIRANEYIKRSNTLFHPVDFYRNDSTLGWNLHDQNYLMDVMNAKGNHFTLFSIGAVQETTEMIKSCLTTLEEKERFTR